MAKYIHYDYAQGCMIAISFENHLQPSTFEYAVHYRDCKSNCVNISLS